MRSLFSLLSLMHRTRQLYWRAFEPTIVGVRALIVQKEQVFLVRHTYLPGWYLPGGRVDRGETAIAALRREVREECGLAVRDARLCGVYSNRELNRNDHIVLFLVEDFAEAPAAPLRFVEIAESGFFPLDDLPPATTAATQRRLQEYRRRRFDEDIW